MLNGADIVILAVLALSALVGLWRGLVGEVLSLAAWVAAFWVAWAFGSRVAGWYAQWIPAPTACIVAGYLTCFIGVLVVGALVSWSLRRLLGRGGLRGGDRTLGFMFGLARGLLVVLLAVAVLANTVVPREAGWWQTSRLLPPFESGAHWLTAQLPPTLGWRLDRERAGLRTLRHVPISTPRRAATSVVPARSVAAPASMTPVRATLHVHPRSDVGQ